MRTLLLIHGPNLNKLGVRDTSQYGTVTLCELEKSIGLKANERGFDLVVFQSNHEGALIDAIQEHAPVCVGMIINPGALTHYSYALHDAIIDSKLPTIEVHLSNVNEREPWRAHSVISPVCVQSIIGKKLQGYFDAVDHLAELLK